MATEYRSPGVYIEEKPAGIRPIEGVGTAIAAFVGFTERAGPENEPDKLLRKAELVTNWSQYTQKFGGFVAGTFLPHAVYGYFANGGGRCYIISVARQDRSQATPAQVRLPASADAQSDSLLIRARQGGPESNRLEVVIEHDSADTAPTEPEASPPAEGAPEKAPTKGGDDTFTLIVNRAGVEVERYPGLSLGSNKSNAKTVVNERSTLIELEILSKGGSLVERRPAEGTYALAGGRFELTRVTPPQFVGNAPQREGLGALEALDDVTMVACPDLMSGYLQHSYDLTGVQAVQDAMLSHCQRMKYRFAILDAPPDMSPQQIADWRFKEARYDSKFGALYYPWIIIANPFPENGATLRVPPCGHMAGIYARTDTERGVHKAPANEVVLGAIDLEINVTKEEQEDLNPKGINCIRAFPGRGIRVWGARTLSQTDQSWKYINVRRLFNYVEASIEAGTHWVVFEPNDQDLWARVRRDVSAFLRRVWRSGALFGNTPEEAFYVKCDEELNPFDEREAGRLIIEVGLAPVKPAEFVIFRISQWAGPNAEII